MVRANGHKTLKVGMAVIYRPSWGYDAPVEVKVENIELCDCPGCKYGDIVDEVAVEDVERSTFDLDNGHWAYGFQIDEIIG